MTEPIDIWTKNLVKGDGYDNIMENYVGQGQKSRSPYWKNVVFVVLLWIGMRLFTMTLGGVERSMSKVKIAMLGNIICYMIMV